jgi:hypothetical protein
LAKGYVGHGRIGYKLIASRRLIREDLSTLVAGLPRI